ncbi:N-acetylglutamate synthase, CG3035 family, partial [Mycolicibacterium sp. XJ1819]
MEMPEVGTRVMIRYRLPAGATPPLTDVIGHLLEAGPTLRVRTKDGEVVAVDTADIMVLRALPPKPVRTADIRKLEHAAALAWPGLEQRWVDGWLLRAAGGHTHRANSAVPLGFDADARAIPAIIDWYGQRGLTPWLSLPDRLFRLYEPKSHLETTVMTRTFDSVPDVEAVPLNSTPDADWLRLYGRDVPIDVLTAVVDGTVTFASIPGVAVGRGAVTSAPDGSRWLGLSAVRVDDAHRRRGHARRLCSALSAWGVACGAQRGYVQVLADNAAALALYESMGFTVQHRSRCVRADAL